MHSATASDAFARWETLEPPSSAKAAATATTATATATATTTTTPWSSPLAPFSLGSAVAASPAAAASRRQHQLQPPPTPKLSADGSFAFDRRGGRSSSTPPPPRPPEDLQDVSTDMEAAADLGNPDSIPGSTGVFDSGVKRHAVPGQTVSSSRPSCHQTIEDGATARIFAATASSAAAAAPVPTLPRQRDAARTPAASRGDKKRESGVGGFSNQDTEALLARLAGKAKQAAAAALSASAASGAGARSLSGTQPPPSTSPPPPQQQQQQQQQRDNMKPIARRESTGAMSPGNENPAPATIGSTSRGVETRRSKADARREASWEDGSGTDVCTAETGVRGPGAMASLAVASAGAGGARLAELCKEDKAKVARLMQDLVKLREEKGGQKARLERLRAQNESIVKEVASLKVKFGQSMQLLRKYQSIIQGGAAGGGAAAAAAHATAGEVQALRSTLLAAEESARKAEAEAAAERAARWVMAEELRRAREQADALLRERCRSLTANAIPRTAGSESSGRGLGAPDDGVSMAARKGARAIGPAPEPTVPRAAAAQEGPASTRAVATAAAPAGAVDAHPEALLAEAGTAVVVGSTGRNIREGASGVGESPAAETGVGAMVGADACLGGGGGGDAADAGGSAALFERRRLEGAEGGVASGAELAAVRKQMETLKQQLVMVGVQQLALTGIPIRDALLGRRAEGCHPLHNQAAATVDLAAVAGAPPHPAEGERSDGSLGGGGVVRSMAASSPTESARAESDRSGHLNPPPRPPPPPPLPPQQQVLPKGAGSGGGRRGREASHGPRQGQWGGLAERDGCGGSTEWSGGEGVSARPEGAGSEVEVEEKDVGVGGFVSGRGNFDDEERVGWWPRPGVEAMSVSRAEAGREGQEGRGGGRQHGRPCSDNGSGARSTCWRVGASAGSTAGDAADAAKGSGKLRVSWSSMSTWSSESDRTGETGPAVSSVGSTSKRGSSGSSGGGRACGGRPRRGRTGETSGAVPREGHGQQAQQQQQQQLVGVAYNRVSPSSYSSSSASSAGLGRQKWTAVEPVAAAGDGGGDAVGAGASLGGAALGRRLRAGAARGPRSGACRAPIATAMASSATTSAGGSYHPRLKTRATAVPGSRRRMAAPPPVAVGGDTSALQPAGAAGLNKTGTRPGSGAFVSKSSRRDPAAAVPAATAASSGGMRQPASGTGRGGVVSGRRRISGSDLAGEFAPPTGSWKPAAAPGRARPPALPRGIEADKAREHGLDRESGDGTRGDGRSETGRSGPMVSDGDNGDDAEEALATLGGESFFDGSLLDLIDDLEELDTVTAATGPAAPRQGSKDPMAAMGSGATPSRRRAEAAQNSSKGIGFSHERGGGARAAEAAGTWGCDERGRRRGGEFWRYDGEGEEGDY